MVSFLSNVVAALMISSTFGWAMAVPLAQKLRNLSTGARDVLKRTTPASPHFVIYQDANTDSFPSAGQLTGFNVYAISFWLTSGPADMAQAWQDLTVDQRNSYLNEYNSAGISLIVSVFGSTEEPTTSGADPSTVAGNLASWVNQYGLQGVDIDYEDFDAFNNGQGSAEQWLITFTQDIRSYLPQGEYILSHAPVAPWFAPNQWSGGGYLTVDRNVGYLIDWYNVQFYNQGDSEYTTCNGLLFSSSSAWPETSLFEIANDGGVERNKLVIGKPGIPSDANNGYIDPSTLAGCVGEALTSGWTGGVMVWEYPDATSSWITTVRQDSWPL